MSKKQVSNHITGQEITFASLVLSGTVTDRQAAETAGLDPDAAASIKAKPRVQAYLHERRAAMNQQHAAQQTDGLRRHPVSREQVLARLWDIANLSPEATRNSATAQIKALSLIIAMEGLIPDRRARSAQENTTTPAPEEPIYVAAWLREKREKEAGYQSATDSLPEKEDPLVPSPPAEQPPLVQAADPQSDVPPVIPAPTTRWTPDAFRSPVIPDLGLPISMRVNPFGRR